MKTKEEKIIRRVWNPNKLPEEQVLFDEKTAKQMLDSDDKAMLFRTEENKNKVKERKNGR